MFCFLHGKGRCSIEKEKRSEGKRDRICFRSEKQFLKKVEEYAAFCGGSEKGRLANAAGFCRYCRITRREFAALQTVYPRGYDLALSTFLDEAVNTKAGNGAQSLAFLQSLAEGGEALAGGGIECAHDAYEDGA